MDNSFTEHVLERARQRQRKLAPLREANHVSASQPNVATQVEMVKNRKEVVSDSILLSPRLTKSNSKTKISSNIISSPSGNECNSLNIQKDCLNMNICFASNENVRVEVEIHSDDELAPNTIKVDIDESSTQVNNDGVPQDKAESMIQQPSSENSSSPTTNLTTANAVSDTDASDNSKPRKGLQKLAELAKDMNQWEDDISSSRKAAQEKKPVTPKKWKPPAPQPPKMESPKQKVASHGKSQAPKPPITQAKPSLDEKSKKPGPAKQLTWDKSVLDTLEQQGFTRTTSNSRLEYNFENSQDASKENQVQRVAVKKFEPLVAHKEENLVTPRSPVKARGGGIASRAALFENNAAAPGSPKKETDPALLSVSQRKALFERNKGEVLVPKAAFGMAAPISKIQPSASGELNKKPEAPAPVATPKKAAGSIAEKIELLNQCSNETTISQQQIEDKAKTERQKDMDVLLNRFNRNKTIGTSQASLNAIEPADESSDSEDSQDEASETTAMITSKPAKIMKPEASNDRKSGEKRSQPGDSRQVQEVLEDVKRIKVTQPKDGKLYPNLSDIEATTETETEPASSSANNSSLEDSCEHDANTSLSREVMGAVYKRDQQLHANQKRVSDYSTDTDVSDALGNLSQQLNDWDSESPGPTPPKHGKLLSPQKSAQPSQSFCYKKYSPRKSSPNRFQSPCKVVRSPKRDSGNLPAYVLDGGDILPLTHTVSFYRKQQTQGSTPVRQITRQPMVEEHQENEDSSKEDDEEVQNKIEHLTREVNKHVMVISQASNALNLCISTSEFTGSTEQVEAEKLLLLAAHRRQAATLEIHRLKVQKTLRPSTQNAPAERGTLTISNISLPLKREYTKALAAAGGKGHHVVCLVKYEEHVVETPLVSTVATSAKHADVELHVPGVVKLENVYSDFRVTLEVYCLQAQEEILPHEVKYRIGRKAGGRLTPRKAKQENRMLRPPKESPAGPQAVRTSAFALNGFTILSVQAVNQTQWTLNQMPPMSPLEGCVSMRVHCEFDVSVEHRGFLNMFEDVCGLGAWHRRWCLLQGRSITYWKYPEDERKKVPINTIDLRSCITKTVEPVSRDICARLHTFLLECERVAQPHDKETLTVCRRGDKTIIKHLLSADTKEERIEWCFMLNKSLTAMRMCGGGGNDSNSTDV